MAKRTTPTTSTIKRETTSAPKRSQRDRAVEIAPHDVARRAYAKFLERGGEHGHDVQDWLEAEAELRAGRGA
ncbi:MAG: DUF2934 domain-containing protein [Myxococcales bacterium]|nr:DUF2934 domain-containing protein [Myxococcales bacterium]